MKLIVDIPDNIYESAKDITNDGVRSMFICGNIKGKPYHEARQGKWIDSEAFKRKVYKCSLCNNISLMPFYNFCPNCGADMREGGKSHEEVHSNI